MRIDVREKLAEIVKKAAYSSLPSNTEDFHLNMFVTNLLAHGVTVQEWISVDDRLPKDGQIVLTCKNGICDIQTYEARRNGWLCKGWFWSMATVTHWMPMPQPPKGG